jgi:hypothetical protein
LDALAFAGKDRHQSGSLPRARETFDKCDLLGPIAAGSPLAIDDSALGEIVRGKLDSDAVARDNPDEVLSHAARNVGHDHVSALDFDTKSGVCEGLRHDALNFQSFFLLFCHT